MRNKMFSGWKDVFLFTLKQGAGRKYITITLSITLLLFAAGFSVNLFSAIDQKNDDTVSDIEKVYIIDESDIEGTDWSDTKNIDKEQYPNLELVVSDSDVSDLAVSIKDKEPKSVIVKVMNIDDHYRIDVYIPYESKIETEDASNLGKLLKDIVHDGLINESGVSSDKITYVVSNTNTKFQAIGEEAKSEDLRMIISLIPMIFMFVIYFMVIIYGQSMGNIVSIEKSSKLMETLLVTIKPYGLIFGKIFATALTAIIQVAAWVIGAVCGFIIGDGFVRESVYASYDNTILSMLKDISNVDGAKAFTTEAIILSALAICFAFLFYCILAGAVASFASKADELNQVMMFYNMALVIGFFGAYIIPTAAGQEWIKVIFRLIPFSSAFLLPGEILVGTLSILESVLYLLLLFAFIILTAVIAGKVYRDQVFYKGKSLKDILPWFKNKNKDNEEEGKWELLHDEAGLPIGKSKRAGYLLLAFSPLLIFFILQILGSFVLTNILLRVDLKGIDISVWEVKDFVKFYDGIESTLNPVTMFTCHVLIILTFGLWIFFLNKGKSVKIPVILRKVSAKKLATILLVAIISGIGLCLFANGVVAIESNTISNIVKDYMERAKDTGLGISPFAIIATVIFAPIGEELVCRGICLYFGKKAFGNFWYANIFQALIFGIMHMNWVQGIYAFFIGLVLGILVERYKSLIPAMLVHFVVNFSSSTWMPKALAKVDATLTNGIIMVVIPSIVVGAVLLLTRNKIEES